MAVYKVIQDIEAEDKLVGPLTLKGFIYALIAGFLAFINVKLVVATQLGYFRWPLIFLFAMPMLLFGVLASPLGGSQPTEIWLLSRVKFFIQPKRRVWDQSGINQLVTITAPKKVERARTKGLNQSQVQSRLKTLAMTMDTRGWAVKNVNVNLTHEPGYLEAQEAGDSDRLIGVSSLPQASLATTDVRADEDMLDEQSNPTAQHFWDLLRISDVERKQKMADKIKQGGAVSDTPKPQPAYHVPKDEELLDLKFREAEASFRAQHPGPKAKHAKNIHKKQTQDVSKQLASEVTAARQADKLELAQSGNDLSVASIQKLANRQTKVEQVSPSEVVISFH
ncbi:MAG TPA: PrgI family protein [Candidatus Saccharimonadales bacterium]|nr:PrgI family protein [Candidatus Saccharimonadales bacterium]